MSFHYLERDTVLVHFVEFEETWVLLGEKFKRDSISLDKSAIKGSACAAGTFSNDA